MHYLTYYKIILFTVFLFLPSCSLPVRLADNIGAIHENCFAKGKNENSSDKFSTYITCFNKNIDEFAGDQDYDLTKIFALKGKTLDDQIKRKIITSKYAAESLDKEFELLIISIIAREIPRLQLMQEIYAQAAQSLSNTPQNGWVGAMQGFYQGTYYALRAREIEYRNYLISKGYQ